MGSRAGGSIVLVVDDEPSIRSAFTRILQLGGYHPVSAATGEAAFVLLERGLFPDAILLDLRLPGMDGLEFLLRLRADPRFVTIPTAIVTGDCFLNHSTERAAQVLGASLHFKPVELDEILILAMRLVHQGRRRDGAAGPELTEVVS